MNNIINLTKLSFINLKALYKQIWFIWIVWIGVAVINPFFLNMLIGLSILLTLYQVMAYEENNGINYLIGTIPVKRKEYVISRYMLGVINLMLSIIVISIVYLISTNISNIFIPLKVVLPIGITSAIVAMSIIIPLILKFGVNKGRVFMSMIIMIIAMAPMSIISDVIKNQEILNVISNIVSSIWFPLMVVVFNILIIVVSIIISILLYQNKEIKE